MIIIEPSEKAHDWRPQPLVGAAPLNAPPAARVPTGGVRPARAARGRRRRATVNGQRRSDQSTTASDGARLGALQTIIPMSRMGEFSRCVAWVVFAIRLVVGVTTGLSPPTVVDCNQSSTSGLASTDEQGLLRFLFASGGGWCAVRLVECGGWPAAQG
eukprot:1180351-Prorocentrum_minimum.AAC.2